MSFIEDETKSLVQGKTQRILRHKFQIAYAKTVIISSYEEKENSYNPLPRGKQIHITLLSRGIVFH